MNLSDRSHKDIPSGETMHALLKRLLPIARSITGEGVRTTLKILSDLTG